jgi:3-oxoacyl-[acyl-carrier protein] reductase
MGRAGAKPRTSGIYLGKKKSSIMNLGIEGRTAIVCASSQGLGLACARALAQEGVNVVLNGRDQAKLDSTAAALRTIARGEVIAVAADVTTVQGQERLLAAHPSPDILINNNAGPAPGNFADIDRDRWMKAIEANMIAPLMMIRAVLPGMKERRFGRIVNITSAMVTTPRPHMTVSSGARAGLTAAMKGLSLDVARHNVTINNLLPERFDTDRQHQMAKAAMARENISYEEARARQVESIAAKRLGDPKEFGATCAFLCSAFAGFMSGQNLHLDGGSYPALI